jgi:hypothetical protein
MISQGSVTTSHDNRDHQLQSAAAALAVAAPFGGIDSQWVETSKSSSWSTVLYWRFTVYFFVCLGATSAVAANIRRRVLSVSDCHHPDGGGGGPLLPTPVAKPPPQASAVPTAVPPPAVHGGGARRPPRRHLSRRPALRGLSPRPNRSRRLDGRTDHNGGPRR